jgi:hypothetical protein
VIVEGSAMALPSVLLSTRRARASLQLGAAPPTHLGVKHEDNYP